MDSVNDLDCGPFDPDMVYGCYFYNPDERLVEHLLSIHGTLARVLGKTGDEEEDSWPEPSRDQVEDMLTDAAAELAFAILLLRFPEQYRNAWEVGRQRLARENQQSNGAAQ